MYLEPRGRKLHSEEPYDLYSSPNIRVMKSRHVRWAEHVACMVGKGNACRSLCGEQKGRNRSETGMVGGSYYHGF